MSERVALVTGGASGIGRACVNRFAAAGWDVGVVDLDSKADAGFVFPGDVRDPDTARRAVSGILDRWGRLDAMVTCAGISRESGVTRMTDDAWSDVLNADLSGTFYFVREAGTVMRERGCGAIVTVSSTLASRARRHLANYIAAKSGVEGLTRAAARDLGGSGVRVNGVAPGIVRTGLLERIPPEVQAKLLDETPLRRFAEPEDVAEVIFFLASDAARHVTGAIVRVDGGMLA